VRILVTGSSGLIGSEAVRYFDSQGHEIAGIDNNMRQQFFGTGGDTTWNLQRLRSQTQRFTHYSIDIRDRAALAELFSSQRFDAVIHCAAQPSHDRAREIPLVDFDVNAGGTINLLEMTRLHCPQAVFILMSTNKVYGDSPNEIPVDELTTRWEYAQPSDWLGVTESCRIDKSLHSLFGASKAAADLVAQEYGRSFGLKVGVFRAGCVTGPSHSGVELHGFLAYLVRVTLAGGRYRVFGYKGKQVRDQIHSLDVVRAFDSFIAQPRPGEVYNLGGGRANNASVIESIELVERVAAKKLAWTYVDEHRIGDHICYISDLSKFQSHFPEWSLTKDLSTIVAELVGAKRP
jgi:CDP-paratose 2-epimerase